MVLLGDCRTQLLRFPDELFQCVITSPPYWGLRDYGVEGEIGSEESIDEFIEHLVDVFRKVRRVLRPDGVLWINIGDTYTSGNRTYRDIDPKNGARGMAWRPKTPRGLKSKELIGLPWRLAFALQADGWFLRTDIVWSKPNAMPESVKDRPSRAHEYLFMLTRSATYSYNASAVREESKSGGLRNLRTVWEVSTCGTVTGHGATFPKELIAPCLMSSSNEGDAVLDPFAGTGTVGELCLLNGRRYIGVELNEEYARRSFRRLKGLTEL